VLWDDADTKARKDVAAIADGQTSITLAEDEKIRRVVLCSGKVYFDLLEAREAQGIDDVYLLRVEQFYPFPAKSVIDELKRFKNADVVWCQEEPKNMGAWTFVEPYLEFCLDKAETKVAAPAMPAGPRRPPLRRAAVQAPRPAKRPHRRRP
jgi:2-oxoglutarate dehydrogenase E1 component